MKKKEKAIVLSQEKLATDIYSMWLIASFAKETKAGQFVSLYCNDKSRLLPRPISICEIDSAQNRIRLVYRVAGAGTKEFSKLDKGDTIEILGPLGNGFPIEIAKGKKVLLIGGGIGIPPMLETAKQIEAEKILVCGYRDELFLEKELSNCGDFFVATEDGSCGSKGNVLDAIKDHALTADMIMACGPTPMLAALKTFSENKEIPCYISMEEKMACGVGACLACVCKSKEVDEHTHVSNKRICKDGPVFLASEIDL